MLKLRTRGTAVLVPLAVSLALVSAPTLAATSRANLSTAVYLSDGSRFPGWSQWSDRDGGWIDGTPWVSGDFNGDGKVDLATVWNNGGSNTITVSLSTGSGFRRSHWATNAGGWVGTTKWAAGDFNGDGKSDIAASWNNGGSLSTAVYLSDGSRFPGWSQWSDRDGGWIDGIPWVAGDFNGDRKADLATVWNNGGSNTITVSLSTGSGFRRSHWATNAGGWVGTTKWAAGDFNGDGKSDIAASWNNGGSLSTAVYLSDGSRFPGWSQWSDRDGGWIDGIPWVAGDFNGDRKADLATVWNNGGSNTITVSLSTGSGFRRSHWATNAGGWVDTTKWAAGDFNGDGKSDIAASWANGDTSGPGDCQKAEERYAGYVDKVPQTAAEVVNAEHALLHLVNVERSQRGLAPLCFNDHLASAARAHSENWATAPDRSCPSSPNWFGCGHWDSRAGYAWPEDRIAKSGYGAYSAMSENTQNGGGRSDGRNVVPAGWTWGTPKAAVYWWMNHDPQNNYANNGHRKAILDPRFKDAGPGVGRYADRFGNRAATFTLMFGAR